MAGGVPNETESTLVAVARVIRFVPSPDVVFRGYDLDLRRALVGGPVDSGVFLRMPNEIKGIQRGSPVLVVADISGQQQQLLTAGTCQPLLSISEAEFIRWTGEP
jgi:hypothetical protein